MEFTSLLILIDARRFFAKLYSTKDIQKCKLMFSRRKGFFNILKVFGVGSKVFSRNVSFNSLSHARQRIVICSLQLKTSGYYHSRSRSCLQLSSLTACYNITPKLYISSSTKVTKKEDERAAARLAAIQRRIAQLPKGKLRKIMDIDKISLEKVLSPEVKTLVAIFDKYNYEIRLAGGPVRDLLMGKIPDDLDFATTATPDQMKEMFETESIRMINARGEKHGTITARINDKENFEITTLRIDVVTDGRHAEVAFTTDWALDAARRDLTVNSMFMDMKGVVYDYFNGADDLKVRKIRFVGDPAQRIQEDYLRILRYFRFYGRLSLTNDDHEEATLLSIKENMGGLQRISGERIWMELKKILTGNYSKELVIRMVELGLGKYIGLPEDSNLEEFKTICDRVEKLGLTVNPITKLSAFLRTEKEGQDMHARLRLSAFERDLCLFIILHRNTPQLENSIKPFQRLTVFSKTRPDVVGLWTEEVMKYAGTVALLESFKKWELPKFPVTGSTLIANKVPAGRLMSKVMFELKEIWIDSDFTASEDELASHLPQILEDLQQANGKSKT